MKFTQWIVLFLISLFLMACPYQSKVPIGAADEKLDSRLMGKWIKATDTDAENPDYFQIKEFDATKYEIEKWKYSSYDSTYSKNIFISHINTIKNNSFLNMQKDGKGDYFLYKFKLDSKSLTLYEFSENIEETFNTSKDLAKFVKQYMHLSFFYNKEEERYVKK